MFLIGSIVLMLVDCGCRVVADLGWSSCRLLFRFVVVL